MLLSNKGVQEFKEIYKREFGEEISDDEAMEASDRFMTVMEIICRPIPGVDFPIEKNNEVLNDT